MGCFGSKDKLSKEDMEFLKTHTRYDESTIKEWYKGFKVSINLHSELWWWERSTLFMYIFVRRHAIVVVMVVHPLYQHQPDDDDDVVWLCKTKFTSLAMQT